MADKFYINQSPNHYVKEDSANNVTVFFDKTRDPVMAAELQTYEQTNGAVTEVWVEPPPTPEALQAEAVEVVMQHMAKAKVAELTWKATVQYHIGDVVYHAGKMWVATDDNISNEPDSIPGDWKETD